ncbi:ferredoxin [Actinomadura sp. LD22]|uniref:Ferredoxin n=1 Tax=Actinomadura physcomitrii TaxID=2650748 RepID=A0A6I4M6E4_9ACTN|nr:ferredoxin [Actinomadura physcomitrii]MVZ99904.1 ferredoxin [Actinomadura physcomitrii]
MKIEVDYDLCENHAQCVFAAPDAFRMNASDELEFDAEVDDSLREDVQSAADACPVQAIRITG